MREIAPEITRTVGEPWLARIQWRINRIGMVTPTRLQDCGEIVSMDPAIAPTKRQGPRVEIMLIPGVRRIHRNIGARKAAKHDVVFSDRIAVQTEVSE